MLFKKLKSVDSLCSLSVFARGSQIMLISVVWIVLAIAALLKTHYIGGCGFKGQNWNHLLFRFVCFCTQSPFLLCQSRSARCSATARSFYARRETWRKRAVIGYFQFKFVSFYGRTGLTWDLQTMSHDWSQLFKFVSFYGHVHSGHVTYKYLLTIGQNYFKFLPFYGKADDVCFQRLHYALSKTTAKDAWNLHFFNLLKKVHQPLSCAYPLPLKYLRKSHFALITTHFRGNFFSIQVT